MKKIVLGLFLSASLGIAQNMNAGRVSGQPVSVADSTGATFNRLNAFRPGEIVAIMIGGVLHYAEVLISSRFVGNQNVRVMLAENESRLSNGTLLIIERDEVGKLP